METTYLINNISRFLGLSIVKKILVFFLVSSVCLNVLIPKNNELKESFLEALSCAVCTMEYSFFNWYVNIVEGLIKDFSGLYEQKLSDKEKNEQNKKEHMPINSSSDSCVILENNISEQTEFSLIKERIGGIEHNVLNKLYILYSNIKINIDSLMVNIGILFFILFAVLIIKIKDTINGNIISVQNILVKKSA